MRETRPSGSKRRRVRAHPGLVAMIAALAAVFPVACSPSDNAPKGTVELTVPTLPSPSLGHFLAPLIKEKAFDHKNNLEVTFEEKPAKTLRTDFAAGTDKVVGSGTLLADTGQVNEKGVNTVYLFNLFDFWGTVVVPSHSSIRSLGDLEGTQLAGTLPTANYAMFKGAATSEGVDFDNVRTQNVNDTALVGTAQRKRADAVEMWEPAYTILTHDSDKYRALNLARPWQRLTGETRVPYLGFVAHRSWVKSHVKLIPRIYSMYKEAANFVQHHPSQAAAIIADDMDVNKDVITALIQSHRLKLHVYPATTAKRAINSVYRVANRTGYLDHPLQANSVLSNVSLR